MAKIRLTTNGLVDVDFDGLSLTTGGLVEGSGAVVPPEPDVTTGLLFTNPLIDEGFVLDDPVIRDLYSPTDLIIYAQTNSTIDLSWKETTSGDTTEYKVYETQQGLGLVDTVPLGTNISKITGLAATTPYTFYVVSSDGTHESFPSNSVPGSTVAADTWQLAAGHFVSTSITGITPQIVHPRPTSETNTDAYCNNAYTGRKWQIPVTVQGGSYPFKYELVTSPSGMVIGETLAVGVPEAGGTPQFDNGNHGTITWETPTEGVHPVSVRVTDQDGNMVTVDFSVTVGTDKFVFIDAVNGDDDLGDGSLASPYKTFVDGIYTSESSPNKICEFLAGTYDIHDGTNGEAILYTAKHPKSYICIDGSATLNMNIARFQIFNISDFYTAGLTYDGSKSTALDQRTLYFPQKVDRITVFNNLITNSLNGTSETENPAFVCVLGGLGAGNNRHYLSVVRNTTAASSTIPLVTTYATSDSVICNNISLQPSLGKLYATGEVWIKFKDNSANCTMRANTGVAFNYSGYPVQQGNQSNYGFINENIEVCWNVTYNATLNGVTSKQVIMNYQTGSIVNQHIYRNTFVCESGMSVAVYETDNNEVTLARDNACYGPWGYNGDGSLEFSQPGLVTVTNPLVLVPPLEEQSTVDINGNLLGTTRDTYLGTRGHEVA